MPRSRTGSTVLQYWRTSAGSQCRPLPDRLRSLGAMSEPLGRGHVQWQLQECSHPALHPALVDQLRWLFCSRPEGCPASRLHFVCRCQVRSRHPECLCSICVVCAYSGKSLSIKHQFSCTCGPLPPLYAPRSMHPPGTPSCRVTAPLALCAIRHSTPSVPIIPAITRHGQIVSHNSSNRPKLPTQQSCTHFLKFSHQIHCTSMQAVRLAPEQPQSRPGPVQQQDAAAGVLPAPCSRAAAGQLPVGHGLAGTHQYPAVLPGQVRISGSNLPPRPAEQTCCMLTVEEKGSAN